MGDGGISVTCGRAGDSDKKLYVDIIRLAGTLFWTHGKIRDYLLVFVGLLLLISLIGRFIFSFSLYYLFRRE